MRNYTYMLLTCLIMGCMTQVKAQEAQIIDKVIANIGSEYMLYSDLIAAYKYQKDNNPAMTEGDICFIFEQIIAQKLLVHQAKLDSIEVSNQELDNALDYRIQNILAAMGGDETRFEEYYDKSVSDAKEQMRDDMRQQMLAERIQQSLISEVTITPKEVVEFYDNIPKDSLPFLSSEVEISEIVLAPEINDVEKEKALTKIEDIRERILSGEATFEEMAQKYSADGTSENGGNLGWQKRGGFVPEFEASAYSLEKDEISEVVETEYGFHVIRLNDRRGNTINCSHILIRPAITQADLDRTKLKLDSIRNLIVQDSFDFGKAVKLFSDKDAQSYNNSGRMTNPKTGNTFFETGDLPTEIYFEIESMEAGDVSVPMEYYAPTGETYYRLVKLITKTKPHKANLEQDYSRIQLYAKESKKNVYYNKWVMEKLAATHIEIDPVFGECENLKKWIAEVE